MGLLDKLFKVNQTRARDLKLTSEEAFLGIVLSAMAADEEFTREEAHAAQYVLQRTNIFSRSNPHQLEQLFNSFMHIIRKEGVGTIVDAAKDNLNDQMKETAFAVAVDLVLADGVVDVKEKEFLEKLKEAVGISDELATRIIEVLMIKNRGASLADWNKISESGKLSYF